MPIHSQMPCWKIVQCGKKENCQRVSVGKKTCWEFVQEDNSCSFHICVDCLVYLAKHEQSTFSEAKFHSIMKQRKKNAHKEYRKNFEQSIGCPIVHPPEGTANRLHPTALDEMRI